MNNHTRSQEFTMRTASAEASRRLAIRQAKTPALRGAGVLACLLLAGLASAQETRPAPAAVDGVKGVKEDAVSRVRNVETGTAAGTKSDAQGVNKINGIDTINGVKADGRTAVPPVKPVVPPPVAGTAANVPTGTTTGTTTNAKGVNKIDGIDTINGVKADGRTAVPPVKPVVPPPVAGTAANVPTGTATGTTTNAKGVNKIDGIDTINGVKADGHIAVPPPPPHSGSVVNAAAGTVGTGGTIHAVNGVAGINAAKLQNLEAALKLKHEGEGTPTGKGKAAAAALLGAGPPGPKPGPKADGRDRFQEFEKLPNTGS